MRGGNYQSQKTKLLVFPEEAAAKVVMGILSPTAFFRVGYSSADL